MSAEEAEFWERAATAALTGLCAAGGELETRGAAERAARLADALMDERRRRQEQG